MIVPLLDLKLQYQTIQDAITACFAELLPEQQFILGPRVEALEKELAAFCGTPFAVGVNSGSDALLLAMMCRDIGPGDLVITTPYTFFATVGSICRLGATPVFADIDPESYNIDPAQVAAVLDGMPEQTRASVKAIIPVHLYGQCADMEPIIALAERYGLTVIEDTAQALGASRRFRGTKTMTCAMGDFGCLSFFPSKNLGCFGDGGMVTARTAPDADKLYSLRMHGQGGERYHHRYIGMNGRLDALQAAVLLVKLPHLEKWAQQRRDNAALYTTLFREAGLGDHITAPATQDGCEHVFNQYVVRARDRDGLKAHLEHNGIGCAIYYPVPLHLQECFAFLGHPRGAFPESEKAARETLALPVFPELRKDQIACVVEQIKRFYAKGR